MRRFAKYVETVQSIETILFMGTVQKVRGLLIESHGPQAVVGELCEIYPAAGHEPIYAEVVGLHGNIVQLMPFSEPQGIEVGSSVVASGRRLEVQVSDKLLGRVLNSMGKPIDGKGDIHSGVNYPAMASPPDVLNRKSITEQVSTGIRAIDGLLPVGKGQRMGIFSGSGVGKSTLLGMIARNTSADINVIALIGERGREVREFIEQDLGEEGLKRSVLIVSTSDKPPVARLKAAYIATAVAEYFRDQGNDVMLMFDSVTRFARAQREIGLAIGEAPATRGFPPSVFSTLPRLLERCGTGENGTITGFYTILVDGDDMDEPVADNVRGILDGHMVLSRRLAQAYHYPSIDILDSVSRLAPRISLPEAQKAAGAVRRLMALYRENEDLINIGAYASGSNPELDEAIKRNPSFLRFLQQSITEKSSLRETFQGLSDISGLQIPLPEQEAEENTEAVAEPGSGAGPDGDTESADVQAARE
ncbi:FliI/YscN family ATPase [Salinispira pacifica]|uniref:Flagellum-specific ATP synthase FliI n=1 Tax=Salinispira pacifica TaxID=1307761 RepID=V5WFK1_9SPIO|nr:FliI/YscN family ATPase [Salinispira pacifica]AHC14582.1 Flagellum-specific ATP synthase FliI [Salinispira pacifica]